MAGDRAGEVVCCEAPKFGGTSRAGIVGGGGADDGCSWLSTGAKFSEFSVLLAISLVGRQSLSTKC